MGMGKWDPWRGMDEFRQQMDRFFDDARNAQGQGGSPGYAWAPLADVLETSLAIIAQVELPGIPPELVVVEVLNGELVVRGERPCERGEPEPAYLLMERGHGTFARRFPLPPGVDSEAITATLRDGLLVVTVPKGRFLPASDFSIEAE